jgi:hypothetical protein
VREIDALVEAEQVKGGRNAVAIFSNSARLGASSFLQSAMRLAFLYSRAPRKRF